MKLLNLYPIQSCNYDCPYCFFKQWLYPIESPKNKLTNPTILRWVKKYLDPKEWLIKITGGEPGLYPGIDELVLSLAEFGYRGIIETNGSLPIPKTDNFIRVAAWHQDKPFPLYYDVVLIIKNDGDDWKSKVSCCVDNCIPYYESTFRGSSAPTTLTERIEADMKKQVSRITAMLMVYSGGLISTCASDQNFQGSVLDLVKPIIKPLQSLQCQTCPQTHTIDFLWDSLVKNN